MMNFLMMTTASAAWHEDKKKGFGEAGTIKEMK